MFKKFTENKPFIIAEVGQNHQGSLENAIKYVDTFSKLGASAVKFQNRNNKFLFDKKAYNKKYDSENAFSDIYGEHREKLELKIDEVKELRRYCKSKKILFMSTPFDEPSLDLLKEIDVDIIKIASFDLGNLPFINRIAKTGKPVVISIGGGKENQITDSVEILRSHKNEIAILHCVSEYPCEYNRLGLENIQNLIKKFPDCTIGSSDHFNGILSGPIAYMLGAKVFEKHVTLNRSWKGTDHSFALEPDGFRKFVRDIERTPEMLKQKDKKDLGQEPVFIKLGKSLVSNVDLKKGEVLTLENLSGKIFNDQHIPVRQSNEVIGKKLNSDLKKGEPIEFDLIK